MAAMGPIRWRATEARYLSRTGLIRQVTGFRSSQLALPELGEHEWVDPAGHHPLLEVLHAGPAPQRRVQVVVGVAAGGEQTAHLGREVAGQVEQRRRVRLSEQQLVHV